MEAVEPERDALLFLVGELRDLETIRQSFLRYEGLHDLPADDLRRFAAFADAAIQDKE